MQSRLRAALAAVLGLLVLSATPALAQVPPGINFGDDTSQWARDGECDDPRFEGAGSASVLLEGDLLRDATDCRAAYEAGTIRLKPIIPPEVTESTLSKLENIEPGGEPFNMGSSDIDFGDNTSPYANDGVCDDPRFVGEGVASVLLEEDRGHDAADCRMLFSQGRVQLRDPADFEHIIVTLADGTEIDFGDNISDYANNGQCDDSRFTGPGMAEVIVASDYMHDAVDCKNLFEAGMVDYALRKIFDAPSGLLFGDDASDYANNGECDDPRFEGAGAADVLLDSDELHDAADCKVLFEAGLVTLKMNAGTMFAPGEPITLSLADGTVLDFGDDEFAYANDGLCDDPRFAGDGSAAVLLPQDELHDGSDCYDQFTTGRIYLAGEETITVTYNEAVIDLGDNSSDWANDMECDDPRFEGEGVAGLVVAADRLHDANDCKAAVDSGRATPLATDVIVRRQGDRSLLDFGDNASHWNNDDECDDPRFAGPGEARAPIDDDIMHDANDCQAAYEDGRIYLVLEEPITIAIGALDLPLGDDGSHWAFDNECDDPRFTGEGSAEVTLEADRYHDATDCLTAYEEDRITLAAEGVLTVVLEDDTLLDFGDNSSRWSNDDECDDPRFGGEGTATVLVSADHMRDAVDCYLAYTGGLIYLVQDPPLTITLLDGAELEFGDNSSRWNNDGECDDPRFTGEGEAGFPEIIDRYHDANDCKTLFETGRITIADAAMYTITLPDGSILDFGDNTSPYADDGICDDPRFEGDGVASVLLDSDTLHDAVDCQAEYEMGRITLKPVTAGEPITITLPDGTVLDFGDNTSAWANDGACDDPRFEGPGAASILLEGDRLHDAVDCKGLFEMGRVTLKPMTDMPMGPITSTLPDGTVLDFGDNTSTFANDNSCDDPRFEGPGVASILLQSDLMHDALDCKAQFDMGRIRLVGTGPTGPTTVTLPNGTLFDFGDNSSAFANDGRCDDPRFQGPGVAAILLESDRRRDAVDCKMLFDNGQVTVIGAAMPMPMMMTAASTVTLPDGTILDFGDNTSAWANDGACDDPRFEGPGAASILLEADRLRDAVDCLAQFNMGRITVRGASTMPMPMPMTGAITVTLPNGFVLDFGDNTSAWANDGACDDPRFTGAGSAAILLPADQMHDAADCKAQFDMGRIMLRPSAITPSAPPTPPTPPAPPAMISSITLPNGMVLDFGDNSSAWANDGACDDPRFMGAGSASILLEADRLHDAVDCLAQFNMGRISLRGAATTTTPPAPPAPPVGPVTPPSIGLSLAPSA